MSDLKNMNRLSSALAMIRSGSITFDQATIIDATLSAVRPDDIPTEDTVGVIDYIDLQLAHNSVAPAVKDHLDRLYNELLRRKAGA